MSPSDNPTFVLPFRDVGIGDIAIVGGKNASLGELISRLSPLGVRVPDGFAVTADAFRLHLRQADLADWIYDELDALDVSDTVALANLASALRAKVCAAPLPPVVREQIMAAYATLSATTGSPVDGGPSPSASPSDRGGIDVAVRSSATAEDLPSASFAGQQETFLNIRGESALDAAVRACMASLFTERAIAYRVENGYDHRSVALSVGVQRMVRSDVGPDGCAGTMFTLDTQTGFRGVVMIDSSWGLGESVVKGRVSPDEYWVHKATAEAGYESVIRKDLGDKSVKLVYACNAHPNGSTVVETPVLPADRGRFTLSNQEALALARWAMAVEQHYAKVRSTSTTAVPMDLEWAKDGRTGEFFIVQARPETVHSRRAEGARLPRFRLVAHPQAIVSGKAVGTGIGTGCVRLLHSPAGLASFKQGDVLVADMTDPDWEPILRKASAVVTDRGGRTCHAAIVSREMGLPCLVGTGTATRTLRDGQTVTVSCAEGEIGHVYEGAVPFVRETAEPGQFPKPRVPLMLNLADPGQAFRLCQLPAEGVAGVGLMRIEFLISNWIGIHPMALVHPQRVEDSLVRAAIERRTAASSTPAEFFVDRLASGIGQIGAAFYPRPVIVRFSDFKSNEYAGLLGGRAFEPVEENPMLGFRGASRYYDDKYREGFALECAAIRRVRTRMGLNNVIVMIPFCRTVEEGRKVLAEMEKHGLRRGENGMQVYVMCEIPNNVILADEFAEIFDGFSIGSNDLTQLALGVDRDSDLLAHVFDERDAGVKRLIETVIVRAHAKGRKVGICGEAPSNYPDFAEWLASVGIDSMSLNPDSLWTVATRLASPAPWDLVDHKVEPSAVAEKAER